MDRIEFYKDLYLFGLNKKKEIDDSLTIPIALLSGIITGIFYSFTTYKYESGINTTIFYMILLLGFAATLFSAFYFMRSYISPDLKNIRFKKLKETIGYPYEYISNAKQLEEHYKNIELSTLELKITENEVIQSVFDDFLANELCICIEKNNVSNEVKSGLQKIGKAWLIGAIVLVCFSLIPYSINYISFEIKNTALNDSQKENKMPQDKPEEKVDTITQEEANIVEKKKKVNELIESKGINIPTTFTRFDMLTTDSVKKGIIEQTDTAKTDKKQKKP